MVRGYAGGAASVRAASSRATPTASDVPMRWKISSACRRSSAASAARLAAAAQALERALVIFRDLGDRGGEATAVNERGTLHRISDDLAQAESCHQRALDLARAIVSAWDEAHALAGLGRCALAKGRVTEAADDLQQALEIFQRIGASEADGISRELAALTEAGSPAYPAP